MDEDFLLSLNGTSVRITPVYEKGTLYLIASLTVLLVWVVFASLYFSRFIGLLISSLVNYYIRFAKIDGSLSISSFSISPLAGKIAFRGVVYACDDYSIRVNDGFILLAYWKFMPNTKAAKCCTSRLSIRLNGMQLYVYNQLSRYREVARVLRLIHLIGEEVKTEVTGEEKSSFGMARFWSLVGVIKVSCTSGKIVLGNPLLPYMMVLNLENFKSTILLEESKKDKKLINCKCSMENVRMVFLKHPSFTGVYPDPPRTMGDGFVVMQTAELTLVYFDDILGNEEGAEQGLTEEDRPVWESIWRFGHNTQFAYGGWAERQRYVITAFFLPPLTGMAPVTEMPRKGQKRIRILHEARISLLHDATLDIYFTRGDELENIQTRLQAGSSIDATVWWITREEGFKWSCKGALLNMQTTTTLIHSPFLNIETFSFEMTALYPRVSNAKQSWNLNLNVSKATVHFVAEHISFLSELSSQWVGDEAADLCTFVPFLMNINLEVQDFEILLLLNEGNWIDKKVVEDNWMGAIAGSSLSLKAVMPFDDFMPEMVNMSYDLKIRGEVAVRMNLPQSRVGSAIYSSLVKDGPEMNARVSKYGRSTSKKTEWMELWRTEGVDVTIEYAYHPTMGSFTSELPAEVLKEWLPKKATHPFQLPSDIMKVNVDIHPSELIASGSIIKLVISLIENYCSSYDKLTEVGGGEEDEKKVPFWRGEAVIERLRPMNILFALRLHHIRAFCMSHSSDKMNSMEVLCEQVEVEVDKNKERSMIQVSLGGCAGRLRDENTSTRDGIVSLSSMQVRGEGLFSPLGVSLDMGSVEYSWTLQLIIGSITANVSTSQMVRITEFIDSMITQVVLEDDKKRIPHRLTRCQHGSISVCCRESVGRMCPSDSYLQLRLIRLSVDRVNAIVWDENTSVLVEAETFRLRICNWRTLHVGIGLKHISARLLINTIGEKCVDAASGTLKNIDLLIKMKERGANEEKERREWVRKHDEITRRVPIVWREGNEGSACACTGVHRLFGYEDEVGLKWTNNETQLAIVQSFDKTCIKYMESMVRRGESACQSQPRAVYMARKKSKEMPSTASSFHSFSNDKRLETCEAYAKVVDTWSVKSTGEDVPELGLKGEIDEWIGRHTLQAIKVKEGIGEARLVTNIHNENVKGTTTPNNANCVLIEGCVAKEVNITLTPLGLEGAEELIESVLKTIKRIPVGYHVQNLFTKCADGGHFHPVLADESIRAKGDWIKDSLMVNVYLSRVNMCLLSSPSPSVYLLSIDHTQLLTTRRDRTEYTVTMNGITGQLLVLSPNEESGWNKQKEGTLEAHVQWRRGEKIEGGVEWKTLLEVHLPRPSATFDRPDKSDEVHLLHVDVANVRVVVVVVDNGRGDVVYSLLSPTVNQWNNSLSAFVASMKKMKNELTNYRQWRLVKLLLVSNAVKESLLKDRGTVKGEMIRVRAQATLPSCPSCFLSLLLLKHIASEDAIEMEDIPYDCLENGVRRQALMMALSNWQSPIAPFIPIPKEINVKDFELEEDRDGENEKEKKNGEENGAKTGGQGGGGVGGPTDLYHYLRSHRRDKKKKEKEERSGALFDPHVFFYSWYNSLKLDETVIDGLKSLRLKAKLSLGNLEIGVVEVRRMNTPSARCVLTHSNHPLLVLEKLAISLDMDMKVQSDKKLALPSQMTLNLSTEARVNRVQLRFAVATFSLMREVGLMGKEASGVWTDSGEKMEMEKEKEKEEGKVAVPLPQWMMEMKSNMGERCLLVSEKRSRASKMKNEIVVTAKASIGDTRIDTTLYQLCATVAIDNTKAHSQFSMQNGTEVEGTMEADTKKATLTIIHLPSTGMKDEGTDVMAGMVHEAKLSVRKKRKDKTNVHVRVNCVHGDVMMGVIALMDLVEDVSRQVVPLSSLPITPSLPSLPLSSRMNVLPSGGYSHVRVTPSTPSPPSNPASILPDLLFKLSLGTIELGARLTHNVKVTLKIEKPSAEGILGSSPRVSARIDDYRLIVDALGEQLRLPLPKLQSLIMWRRNEDGPAMEGYTPKKGHFLDILLSIGSVSHIFPTDVLNAVLYVEMALRAEMKRFKSEMSRRSQSSLIGGGNYDMNESTEGMRGTKDEMKEKERDKEGIKNEGIMFALRIECSSEPWLSLCSTTPANTGVQLQINSILVTLSNRWKTKSDRLLGLVRMQTELRLGQIMSTMTDMDRFASFSTQLSVERKEGTENGTDTFNCHLTRPLLIVHPRGIERAILLWLHCKDSFDRWNMDRREKGLLSAVEVERVEREWEIGRDRRERPSSLSPLSPSIPSMTDISLSLLIIDFSLRVPLRAESCLLLVLKKADAALAMRTHFAFRASFDAFKITILESVTQEAMLDYADYSDEDPRSNFLFFPKGVLELGSEASSSSVQGAAARVKVKGGMSGMIVDVDHRVGRLAKLLISAFSHIGEMSEEMSSSVPSLASVISSSDEEDLLAQMKKLEVTQDREKWLERKIRDQSDLVKAFVDCNASAAKVEEERKVLRRMENARLKYFMAKIRSGDADDKGKTKAEKDSRTVTGNPLEKVNMNISAELNIASGKCSLRTPTLTSRASTRDLGIRVTGRATQTTSTLTTIIIPSVSANGVYHSSRGGNERGSLHLAISLQSIATPQILTPHMADFVEMMLDPLPSSWHRSEDGQSLSSLASPSSPSPSSPSPRPHSSSIDTNTLPFDFLILLNIDASEIKFLGQQPRSSAADCRLQLPSLSLAASSRVLSEGRSSLDVSASLSKFSLAVYSPHQTTNHDALSLSLDHLAFVVSRSKNAGAEKENRVEMVATVSIGNALIAYDGRRISELVSFPKPWYRASVVRRLFFGDKYMQPRETNSTKRDTRSEKRWRTKIVVGVRWKELDVKVQMGNTMGSTIWNVKNGEFRTLVEMSSEGEMSGDGMLSLDVCRLNAMGGAIGGDISLKKLLIKCRHTNAPKTPPTNSMRVELKEMVARLEWMSRTIVLAETTLPSVSVCDLWTHSKIDNEVREAAMSMNASVSWKTLQLVITSSTVGDVEKMIVKLASFFKDQLRSSKMMWETAIAETNRDIVREGKEEKDNEEEQHGVGIGYWQSLLDMMINIQHGGLLPFPVGEGSTFLKTCIHVAGDSLSMVLMNGEMGSSSWALFHFQLPSLLFSTQTCLKFRGQGEEKELIRLVVQRAVIALGKSGDKNDKQAVVTRVQWKGVGMTSSNNTREMLDTLIVDSLKGGKNNEKSCLDLFQFPTLEAVYQSEQEEETVGWEEDEEERTREVKSTFTCQFYGVVSIQTELNAQLGFLPDLVNSYKKKESAAKSEIKSDKVELTADERIHKCIEWDVEPRIGFIDKFRWEPPVIDEVLKKLQIFDHRNTIPKVLQRSLMDSLDKASALILKQLLKFTAENKPSSSNYNVLH